MAYAAFDNDDTYQPRLSDLWDQTPSYAPTPGREWTPSIMCSSTDPERIFSECSSPLHQPQSDQLGFMREDEVDVGGTHEEQRLNYVHYKIEWRVKLNNRVVAKDTEQDLALPPSSYWERIKYTTGNVLRRKIAHTRRVRLDDTNLVVSVNERSQSDLIKRFEGASVDWTTVEKQLLMWANLYRLGKKLRIQITINYIDDRGRLPSRSDKRGNSSVTKGMLTERDAEMDAEQASGGHVPWRDVYRIMRCPGPPCRHEGQYCWQDPQGKKHYRLRTTHLKILTRYVQQGGVIETHDDIPDSLREQLYAEENQRLERRKKSSDSSTCGSTCHPVHFHLPSQVPVPTTTAAAECTNPAPKQIDPIDIPGLLDIAVKEYATWHQSRVSSETSRENIQKARDVALEYCLDLKQIHEDQDPDFFVKHGVKAGAARRLATFPVG
ncbi:hypothetical protein DTO013E5_9156 [Penicillium roqueforti]|uniref:Uncharacterized protein n=1 Tax=Penicillium nordicum TaxID=229535 RepID=A0A0M9WB19_9EURO|nr:hypothetical protein DTO012A1_9987 [Penicillium roqueforti]KOS38112.1 hypothetical protein ACN38_g11077 [Penicillium nordicum]KAI2738001.1 hypothetical protein DTO013F2_9689 [Penicillium roqueforti]KAI2767769.1 hypothetical protein DTO012A8_7023 [Penicillium roqueforti]KAI3129635.1 hypothetical protein CBS147325_9595 [Penicillium roqueforti]